MKTEHKLAETLKTLLASTPLDEISVTALTDRCGVNRKTFYYHFHDIYDLLTLVFLDESIPEADEAKNINQMIKAIYRYYSKNHKFIDATLSSAGKDLFQEFIYNISYKCLLRFVVNVEGGKKLKLNDRKSIARFYAYGYTNSIVYYLATYKNKSLEGLNLCFAFLNEDNLEKSVNRMLKIREKEQ